MKKYLYKLFYKLLYLATGDMAWKFRYPFQQCKQGLPKYRFPPLPSWQQITPVGHNFEALKRTTQQQVSALEPGEIGVRIYTYTDVDQCVLVTAFQLFASIDGDDEYVFYLHFSFTHISDPEVPTLPMLYAFVRGENEDFWIIEEKERGVSLVKMISALPLDMWSAVPRDESGLHFEHSVYVEDAYWVKLTQH